MPTPNFCSWQSIKEGVAANLHVAPGDLPTPWDVICSRAARRSAAELRRIFIMKGYRPDQLASWDDIVTYSQMLGEYFALVEGSSLANYDLKSVDRLDCRKEITDAAALIIGGAAAAPSGSDVGGIASGGISAVDDFEDDRELFV